MEIVAYNPAMRDDFVRLNRAWIEQYFEMEPEDFETLGHVEDAVENGAEVFFAVEDKKVLATGMIQPLENGTWEICKLATEPEAQGRGAGSAIFRACVDYAVAHGASRLLIVSNRMLKPALHIYKKFGFKEIPVDNTHHYQRGDIQLEYLPADDRQTD